jgi:hypothetical protein
MRGWSRDYMDRRLDVVSGIAAGDVILPFVALMRRSVIGAELGVSAMP